MLSSASKYAINAVLYLAVESSEDKKIGAKEVAEAIGVPTPFLAKLLQNLAKKNVISSLKGPKGGFFLSEENKSLKLISVVEHIDGLSKFEECVLGLKNCSNDKPCPIHFSVQPFKNTMFDELSNNTIEAFAVKVRNGETFLHY
ncbi:Rrf2 family transcriptional regulator [Leptobacterium flavescens]|uniref:Rrf2 family transcriptional regulator n=1 Tax=Leptobacterium flavescens TaxID=472055 RepID=A0A6P0URU5_9FLAO|nr:Rrf2 family transcriptional regulator [Leptobacterium flavescens]NER14698.1 Rrf2 family transcriptional regulator [Leptobacterium flavescens]